MLVGTGQVPCALAANELHCQTGFVSYFQDCELDGAWVFGLVSVWAGATLFFKLGQKFYSRNIKYL